MNGDGVAYMIRKQGGPRVDGAAAARGWFRWAGEYWQDNGGQWGDARGARYYTPAERERFDKAATLAGFTDNAEIVGGEWVAVFVNVPADGGQA